MIHFSINRSSTDRLFVVALFIAAFVIGSMYERAFDRTDARSSPNLKSMASRSMWYGQADFGAAVALACGRGYVNPPEEEIPALERFLALQVDRFSCADLPATLTPKPLGLTQRLYPYLLSTVALAWKLRGVSWSALWPLFGLFYGVTIVVVYGLLRLGMRPRIAAVLAAVVLLSPIQLGNLPGLRDFAKAPFILGLVLIAAQLVRRRREPRAVVGLSVLFGATLGVGFGFRNDLMIVLPLLLGALLVWDPPRSIRDATVCAAALAAAVVTFVVVAWPILSGYTRGSNTGHVALLGLMSTFDEPLGVTPSVYEWGHVYSDGYIDAIVRSYSYRVHDRAVSYLSPEYDRMAVEYLARTARDWPADMITRAYASVLRIADMPFHPGMHAEGIPYGADGAVARRTYVVYDGIASLLPGAGLVAVFAALLIVSGTSLWASVLLLTALLYLAGYPAIQFQPRHYFHLEFIPWLAAGFVVERAFAGERRIRLLRIAVFVLIATSIVGVPLAAARVYQQQHARKLIAHYVDAPRDLLAAAPAAVGDRTLLRLPTLWTDADAGRSIRSAYVVARLSPAACPVISLPLTFRYRVAPDEPDFSLDTTVTFLPRTAVDLFVPAYDVAGRSAFDGIEVSRGFEGCVEGISRVRHPAALPLLVTLRIREGWQQTPLYERLTAWEVPATTSQPALYVLPPTLTLPVSTVDASVATPPVLWTTEIVHDAAANGWAVRGTPRSPIWPLIEFAAERRTPDDRFVIEGDVRHGGISVGLVRDHQWTINGHVTIAKPGHFIAVMAPFEPGEFGALCENGLRGSWFFEYAPEAAVRFTGRFHDFNDVRITRAGWVH